jgi:hypothetical protein
MRFTKSPPGNQSRWEYELSRWFLQTIKKRIDEPTWHVVHNHIKIFCILEGKVKSYYPLGIGVSHNVPFFPKEC